MQLMTLSKVIEFQVAERNAKYEELMNRDREMQDFLDKFDEKRYENLTRNAELERNIEELLHRLSSLSRKSISNLPSASGFSEMKSDLAFKEKEMKNSENTMDALLQERDRRMQDLEKVGQLEVKLGAELEVLRSRITELTTNLGNIGDLDKIKAEAELNRKVL